MGGMRESGHGPAPGQRGHPPLHRDAVGGRPSGCSGSLRCSGCRDETYAKVMTANLRLMKKLGALTARARLDRPRPTTTSSSSAPGFGGSVSGAAADREGLPGRRARGGCALRGRGLRRAPRSTSSASCSAPRSAATASSASTPSGLPDPRRRRRRRRLAGLRQHALRAAGAVLRRPAVARHHRLEGRARAVLRPGQADARRRREPPAHAVRRGDGEGRRRPGRRRHLPPDARSGSSSAAPDRQPGETVVADPYFGGAGPDRNTCLALRRVHDRLPAQRQEHPGQELPLPRRAERRAGAPADHGHPGRAARVTAAGTTYACSYTKAKRDRAARRRTITADQVVLRRRRARHPAAAAPDEGRGPPARALRPARPPLAHQLRVDPRARSRPTRRSTTARAWRSPRRSTPTTHTHIEPVRYGKGSNVMSLLQTVLTDGDGPGRAGAPG